MPPTGARPTTPAETAPAAVALRASTARGFVPLNADLARLAAAETASPNVGLGLAPGARVLLSRAVQDAMTQLDDVLADRAIVLIEGPPGTGKTLLEHLLMARARQLGAQPVRVQAGRRPSGKQLSARILTSLRPGIPVPKTQNQTEDELKRILAPPTLPLVVYDEVQHLGVRGIEDIRYYWDETPDRFPLVLSGVNVSRVIAGQPQLEDRIAFRYELTTMNRADSVAFAAQFHPLLADLAQRDPGLLAEVDHCGVHGTPRRWSTFVKQTQFVLARTSPSDTDDSGDHITDRVAYTALARFANPTHLRAWSRDRP